MNRPVQAASSAIVAAIAFAATPAMASDSTRVVEVNADISPISMDQFGNLKFSGSSSDDLLASSYGLLPDDAGLLALDVNVGKCTVTNNCACGNTPQKPSGQ